jgi:hypothetical protein
MEIKYPDTGRHVETVYPEFEAKDDEGAKTIARLLFQTEKKKWLWLKVVFERLIALNLIYEEAYMVDVSDVDL